MAFRTICPSSKQLASSLLLAAILSGCASQQTLRVVDRTSGEPLGDVAGEGVPAEPPGHRHEELEETEMK